MPTEEIVRDVREFNIQNLPLSCTWIIVGPPGSGKTSFIENLAYYNKHRYPVGRAFMGTPSAYKRFCDIFHPLYVSQTYDEEAEKDHITRQRTCIHENNSALDVKPGDPGYVGNYAMNILDDVTDDPKIFKSKVVKGLFKLGSQHWAQMCLLGTQYALDMPADVRKSVSYVAIFREPEENERRKLYENFGGLAGTYRNFCDLMDGLTGNYTCIVFQKRSQSNSSEDNVFYYPVQNPDEFGDWKFGCKEAREHAERRYNKNYKEDTTYV
jgi:energy-coupling factor transporter ATP-binding protein EcfA2